MNNYIGSEEHQEDSNYRHYEQESEIRQIEPTMTLQEAIEILKLYQKDEIMRDDISLLGSFVAVHEAIDTVISAYEITDEHIENIRFATLGDIGTGELVSEYIKGYKAGAKSFRDGKIKGGEL